ncbi:MAG: thymidine phosphorylase [Chloroflexota bacterium]|nr:MAG: thymidine phosphorylase [Chloroflexota bacterium]
MRAVDIIIKKRDGGELTREEIEFFVQGFTEGSIPDYQASAWTMAVLLNGMTPQETTDLTMAMVRSGEILDLSPAVPLAVDKHSSGGVGDKTTLVVEPLVAACGLPVGKMSGRGLGFTGGTLDKMESIPGFRVNLSQEEFLTQLDEIGLVLSGQTAVLAPADGKFYALRDVSGTVDSIPLIASSIMSKKIAAGAQAIVLDVKIGLGAFMETQAEARELARFMVDIAHLAHRKAVALISDMNQPLGIAVGNILEVKEAIATLQGGGPQSFLNHCLDVAEQMLVLGNAAENLEDARKMAQKALQDGSAWERFLALVEAQGGDVSYVKDPDKFPQAALIKTIPSPESGYLSQIHARIIGETSVDLGAGRAKKGDPINHTVGIEILKEVGDFIKKGQDLFIIHASSLADLEQAEKRLLEAHRWSDQQVPALPLVYEIIC